MVIESPRVLIKQSDTVCVTLLVCVHFRQAAILFISGDIFLVTLSAGYINAGGVKWLWGQVTVLMSEMLIHLFNQFIQTWIRSETSDFGFVQIPTLVYMTYFSYWP